MSTAGHYLTVFTSNKTSPKWRVWHEMSGDERRANGEIGIAALKAWDAAHQDVIVCQGGPRGPGVCAAPPLAPG